MVDRLGVHLRIPNFRKSYLQRANSKKDLAVFHLLSVQQLEQLLIFLKTLKQIFWELNSNFKDFLLDLEAVI